MSCTVLGLLGLVSISSSCHCFALFFFFFNDTATTEIYTLSLHDALPISIIWIAGRWRRRTARRKRCATGRTRSEEHTSELQSLRHLVCRLLLEKKKKNTTTWYTRLRQTLRIVEL